MRCAPSAGPHPSDAIWDDRAGVAELIDGSDLLINLAGRSVGCRYTDANRQEIWNSRVHTTRALNDAVRAASAPPRLWINSSTATIYRHSMDRPQTEEHGEIGEGRAPVRRPLVPASPLSRYRP
ncbi:NAD-dependent epimerase/dehydratase family protein [Brevibacterium renqingii]|uniref:NAD-dependent epimerase/dehydratase family protein n=1 Tax=Brevibacterium renqingii TaxID=2776916 RepID=UPI0031B5E016